MMSLQHAASWGHASVDILRATKSPPLTSARSALQLEPDALNGSGRLVAGGPSRCPRSS